MRISLMHQIFRVKKKMKDKLDPQPRSKLIPEVLSLNLSFKFLI